MPTRSFMKCRQRQVTQRADRRNYSGRGAGASSACEFGNVAMLTNNHFLLYLRFQHHLRLDHAHRLPAALHETAEVDHPEGKYPGGEHAPPANDLPTEIPFAHVADGQA